MQAFSAWLAGLTLLWLAGCAPPVSRDDLAKEVLQTDPEFGTVLDKHREVANRIDTYQRELALKRSTVERSIAQLRKDLKATTQTVQQKIVESKKRLKPDQDRLESAMTAAGEELKAKRFQRASVGRSIARIRKAAGTSGSTLSVQERAHHESQLKELLSDAARLDQEIAALKRHIRLLKVKRLLIKV